MNKYLLSRAIAACYAAKSSPTTPCLTMTTSRVIYAPFSIEGATPSWGTSRITEHATGLRVLDCLRYSHVPSSTSPPTTPPTPFTTPIETRNRNVSEETNLQKQAAQSEKPQPPLRIEDVHGALSLDDDTPLVCNRDQSGDTTCESCQ